jgi:hypothetical protein
MRTECQRQSCGSPSGNYWLDKSTLNIYSQNFISYVLNVNDFLIISICVNLCYKGDYNLFTKIYGYIYLNKVSETCYENWSTLQRLLTVAVILDLQLTFAWDTLNIFCCRQTNTNPDKPEKKIINVAKKVSPPLSRGRKLLKLSLGEFVMYFVPVGNVLIVISMT